jgi:hypothetical protein
MNKGATRMRFSKLLTSTTVAVAPNRRSDGAGRQFTQGLLHVLTLSISNVLISQHLE